MKKLRIIFMGTPSFAVATLEALVSKNLDVVAVVTAPDKPAGRGRKLTTPAVKEYAESVSLPVLQPLNLKDSTFINQIRELNPDLIIVVAFRMLPEAIWRIPKLGTFNLHASLLPQYRGAAPINHAIINGESITGVTTFYIDDRIDTGSLLLRKEVRILPSENAGDLHDKLMKEGAGLVIRTIEGIAEGNLSPTSQHEFIKTGEALKTAPKLTPEFCIIDWDNDPFTINNFIRGLAPYPAARSSFRNSGSLSFKVLEGLPEYSDHHHVPGTFITDRKKYIKAACKGGFINIISLQPEGKKKMHVEEFLRGFRTEDYNIVIS